MKKNDARSVSRLTVNLWPEAAHMLGVSRSKIYEMAKCGQLPIIKAGRRILVSKAALERHVDEASIA